MQNISTLRVRITPLLEAKCLEKRELEEILIHLIKLATVKARNDFYTFVKLMAHVVLPQKFIDGRHIKLICQILEKSVREVENKNVTVPTNPCISLPPGSSKSVMCSQLLPTWGLGRNPHWFILAIGHSENFMVDNSGRKAKDLMTSKIYRILFPETRIREDVQAAGRFYTDKNGMFVCAGWTTNIAGRRATLAILDDVVSEQSAQSDAEMKKIRDWYGGGLESRLLAKSSVINLATRWRPDDLIGYALQTDKKRDIKRFLEIRFPAINDKLSSKLLNLPVGGSFWPELWPLEVFLSRKESLSPAKWQSLYLQNPVPEEGNVIKWDWVQRWEHDDPPNLEFVLLSIDPASTKDNQNDPTGWVVMGIFRRSFRNFDRSVSERGDQLQMICLGGGEDRMDHVELLDFIDSKMAQFGVDVLLVEEAPISMLLVQDLKRRGYPIIGIKPRNSRGGTQGASKLDRMLIAQPSFMSGRVFFPANKRWADDCISKLCQFPAAGRDFGDATSQVVNWIQTNYNLHTENELTYDPFDEEERTEAPATYWQRA